jgi:glycosyltransferase involved in cell wall biosynthesis
LFSGQCLAKKGYRDKLEEGFPVRVGVVVIGRNEGERLKKCLDSVVGADGPVVYVDSGSTDGSVEMARARGVETLPLDSRAPFTAARARNEGFRRLRELAQDLAYVQFVDGDCEVVAHWLAKAVALWWGGWSLILLLAYPLQVVRLAVRGERSVRENWWRAAFLVLGKFPEMIGQVKFILQRYLGEQSRLIEYK